MLLLCYFTFFFLKEVHSWMKGCFWHQCGEQDREPGHEEMNCLTQLILIDEQKERLCVYGKSASGKFGETGKKVISFWVCWAWMYLCVILGSNACHLAQVVFYTVCVCVGSSFFFNLSVKSMW